jgi:hypothetical protein
MRECGVGGRGWIMVVRVRERQDLSAEDFDEGDLPAGREEMKTGKEMKKGAIFSSIDGSRSGLGEGGPSLVENR